jgi:hypothetical protein
MGVESSKLPNDGVSNPTGYIDKDFYRGQSLDSHHQHQNITRIEKHVQQRLTKGVSYNMKIIIRGKRKSGKSMLFRRLKGLGFTPEVRSHEIWL